ncbi:metallophosphoesterase family protein [Clostridium magnum]|uniref:Calcineurin-like phosphoesterase n=1 Tax=Clostridium magnum DSM 2767 TaxID=1121326 RepID=A0A162UJH4_9CLOT|nr:metallophosphoesterase [Clostridium magnum]KZL93993.1 calcineurin-like phosphoesterase [Clostridium magnum DSM 2767]SHI00006.1 Calcineurin-like phosphoesterase [Clostridium magnum DSM 2767]
MRKNKFIILIFTICLMCTGYIIYRSYGVKAMNFSKGKFLTQNSNVNSAENQKKIQGQKSGKAGKKDNIGNTLGIGATPALTMTSVPENGFSFAIQADSHLDENTDINLYKQTLQNIVSKKPSFLIDLGDTFMSEKFAKTQHEVEQRYIEAKSYFGSLGSIPLYLVTGNHDGENGWDTRNGQNNMLAWARNARLKYFPPDISEASYSGNRLTANYYSFIKGDVQFIVLDPFTYSTEKARGNDDGWKYTLGKTQYDWFKSALENSNAKYKFVFIHNLVGGYSKDARGGAEAAKFFEWGGYSPNGNYEFDKMRPGWGKPIHQLMLDNNVTAVFHGHDHFYGKQSLDGIIYQLVPQPGTPGNSVGDAAKYSYKDGVFLPSAGYLRVVVSDAKVVVEYVKTSLQDKVNKSIPDSYTVSPK